MADEETTQELEAPEEEPRQKKKMILFIGAAVAFFILASAVNYVHLKITYVPPEPQPVLEPVVVEDEGPILTIDLSDEPEVTDEYLAEAVFDSVEGAVGDSATSVDSIQAVIDDLRARVHFGDSLLAETVKELERVRRVIKHQDASEDSTHQKRAVKLAKIVGNMPAAEAAKMLAPLDDAMVLNILLQLKQRQAAKIMAEFSATRSARLSEAILKPLVSG